jgi:hypothetical protein
MKRSAAIGVVLALVVLPLQCATLAQLSMSDMIAKSTAIVRAKVVSSYAAMSGPVIYTHYQLQVGERYKGAAQSTVDLAIPGGVANGVRQVWGGAPQLDNGADYVFFLWTGKSGLTQVMGLSQGLFTVAQNGSTDPTVTHTASHELMLDHNTGRAVKDQTLTMPLSGLKAQIAAFVAASTSTTLAPQGTAGETR